MSNTLKIIARVRETTETGTNYAVAKALGIPQSLLDRILKGQGYLGDKAQRHAATVLDVNFDDINALVNEDKAKSEPERAYWRSLCSETVRAIINATTTIAASLIATTALIFLAGNPSTANTSQLTQSMHYAPYGDAQGRLLARSKAALRILQCRPP